MPFLSQSLTLHLPFREFVFVRLPGQFQAQLEKEMPSQPLGTKLAY